MAKHVKKHASQDSLDIRGGSFRADIYSNNPRMKKNAAQVVRGAHASPRQYGASNDKTAATRSSLSRAPRHASSGVKMRNGDSTRDAAHSYVGSHAAGAHPGSHELTFDENAPFCEFPSDKKKKPLWKKVLIGAASLILILAAVLAGVVLGYANKLDAALAPDSEQAGLSSQVLVPAESGEPVYLLLLGSDSREGSGTSNNPAMQGDQQRSDVMILLRVDASSRHITMLSIPRDTPYRLDDGSLVKINEAYNINGAAGSIQAVSELTGVPISHYATVHFSEFQAIVDALGGVTVNVPVEMSYKDALTGETVTIQPGEQTLSGQQAQIFVRSRKVYDSDQDARRQDNVRTLLDAIIDKALNRPVSEIPSLVLELAGYAETDLRTFDLVALAAGFALGEGKMTIYSGTGPTDGAINEDAGGMWLCYEDPEGWAELMAVVDTGGNPKDLGK